MWYHLFRAVEVVGQIAIAILFGLAGWALYLYEPPKSSAAITAIPYTTYKFQDRFVEKIPSRTVTTRP